MNNPKPEHRISFLERQFVNLGGHIEGLQENIKQLEAHVDLGFLQARDLMMQELGEMKQDIASIKSTQEQILQLLQQKP